MSRRREIVIDLACVLATVAMIVGLVWYAIGCTMHVHLWGRYNLDDPTPAATSQPVPDELPPFVEERTWTP